MDNTYSALKKRVREALIEEWPRLFQTPGYYHHPPSLNPRPFMGLDKFTAGRVHQMRAGKSYQAAYPTWRSPDADTSCPRCGLEPETFEHAIPTCPSRQGARSRLLHGITSVGQDAPLWSSLPLLKNSPPSSASPPLDSPLQCFRPILLLLSLLHPFHPWQHPPRLFVFFVG